MRPNHTAVTIAALAFVQHCAPVLALPNADPSSLSLIARAECKPYKIASGDDCSKIAKDRCKIKLDDLYKYNSGLKAKCSSLKVSQNHSIRSSVKHESN